MTKLIEALKRVNDQIDYENEQDLIDAGLITSFEVIGIIEAIEESYGIEIPPKEITNDNFRSVETILSMIERIKK